MKNKGFTLIELLGVIVILAILMIVVFPSVISTIKSNTEKTENQVDMLIKNSAKLYINDNIENYVKSSENTYCIPITELIGTGGLTEEIINASGNITLDYIVEAKYNIAKNKFLFNITEECIEEIITQDVINID